MRSGISSGIRAVTTNRPSLFQLAVIEASLVGLFLIQGLRFLIGTVYSRVASASQVNLLDAALIDPSLPGIVQPNALSSEIAFLVYMLALPLIAVVIGRFHRLMIVAVGLVVVGRYLMVADTEVAPTASAGLVVGGGLLYVTLLVRHRARALPFMFVIAFAADQLFRAAGNTVDLSLDLWHTFDYEPIQLVLSIVTGVLALYTVWRYPTQKPDGDLSPDRGLMSFWSGLGLGALLFVEMALLTMPNVLIARAEAGYELYPVVVPFLLVATTLPLLPMVRTQVRSFIGLLDSSVRGWSWMLVVVLLVILGTRFAGPLPVVGLVFAQFCISLMWWWLTRPQAKQEMNLTGLWMLVAALAFGVLVVFDLFTFEYAFVRDFSSSLDFLNDIVPPLLRGFRGLGIAVIILAVFLSALPMVQSRRRIPWSGGGTKETFFSIIAIAGCGLLGAYYASPPVIRATVDPTQLRIASFNIHGGYNEFFDYNLSGVAGNIGVSGADLVLLQEVEAGRLTSFGIDQPLWLARETGMDVRFYGPNEDLQGLAVLSRMAFAFSEGTPLESVSTQTGLQFVQVLPDPSDTGRPINVFNTWLGPLLATDSERTVIEQQVDQHEQLREIFDVLAGLASGEGLLRSRTVLGGTFNNVPDSPLIGTIRGLGGSVAIFEDPFAGMAMEASATYIRSDIRSRLDYMWLTSGLPVYGVGVDDSPISDHRLIFVEVELP